MSYTARSDKSMFYGMNIVTSISVSFQRLRFFYYEFFLKSARNPFMPLRLQMSGCNKPALQPIHTNRHELT